MTVYFVTFESDILIQLITAFIKHHFGSSSIPCYGKILNDLLDVTRHSMFRRRATSVNNVPVSSTGSLSA